MGSFRDPAKAKELALAMIENQGELKRLRDDMSLMPLATEEIIRWVVPVKEFMRTAQADTSVRGVPIAKGESVLLSYVSANRDADVFTDPFRFDVGRDPNKHLSFGHGVHFCLGAALARMEINSFFTALLPRLKSISLRLYCICVSRTMMSRWLRRSLWRSVSTIEW